MKQIYYRSVVRFLLISAIFAVPVNAQDTDIFRLKILPAVQNNIDLLKEQMVDLISEQEIVIEEFNDKEETTRTTGYP